MSVNAKWIMMGSFEVIADDTGKIIAHIQIGSPSAPLQPMDAVVRGRSIGKFINVGSAKTAIERELNIGGKNDDSLIRSMVSRFHRMTEE